MPAGAWFRRCQSLSVSDNYITEIMSVLLEQAKRLRSVQQLELASRAFRTRIPSSGAVTLGLFVRRSGRSAIRTSGPSERRVRHVSSPVRFQIMRALTRAGVTPNPIDDNADCRIPSAGLDPLMWLIHAGTIDIVCRFPAALVSRCISS